MNNMWEAVTTIPHNLQAWEPLHWRTQRTEFSFEFSEMGCFGRRLNEGFFYLGHFKSMLEL